MQNRIKEKQEACPYCHPPYFNVLSKFLEDGYEISIKSTKDDKGTYFYVLVSLPNGEYVYTDLNAFHNCPMCGRSLDR